MSAVRRCAWPIVTPGSIGRGAVAVGTTTPCGPAAVGAVMRFSSARCLRRIMPAAPGAGDRRGKAHRDAAVLAESPAMVRRSAELVIDARRLGAARAALAERLGAEPRRVRVHDRT